MIRFLAFCFAILCFFAPLRAEELRIVSLAPSLTETVHALGASEQLVGVSQYCKYPQSVSSLPKVGALFQPNFELLIRLRPDLVLILEDHAGLKQRLDALGIHSVSVGNESIADIKQSVTTIAHALGREARGVRVRQEIEDAEARYAQLKKARSPKKVLVVVESNIKNDKVSSAIVAGNLSFYHDILNTIGAFNVIKSSIRYPRVSAEAFLSKDVDILLLLFPETFVGREKLIDAWKEAYSGTTTEIRAIAKDVLITPGPRVVKILDGFYEQIVNE